MCRPVLLPCEACQSEGRIYRGQYDDERDFGRCPVCDGTGMALVESEPVELEDLENYNMTNEKPHGEVMDEINHQAMYQSATEPRLSHDDLCRLSRAFNQTAYLGIGTQDHRINEWLKAQIAAANQS